MRALALADLAQRQAAHHQRQHLRCRRCRPRRRRSASAPPAPPPSMVHARTGRSRCDARNAVHRLMPQPHHAARIARRTGANRSSSSSRPAAPKRLVLGLVTDDVDHVIDGDAAEQDVVVVDHRRRRASHGRRTAAPLPGHRLADVDGRLLVVDQAVDRRARRSWVTSAGQRQRPRYWWRRLTTYR